MKNKNIGMVTLLNELFVIGFKTMLNSLLINNTWFNLPIVILDENLKKETKKDLFKMYNNIYFEPVKKSYYNNVNFSITSRRLRDTYYKLDIFRLEGFDRLIFIDSDVIILKSIKKLFETSEPFAAVRAYDASRDILRKDINSGIFVINKQYLNPETYTGVLKIAMSGHKMPDQATINMFFKNKITFLDKTYNVEKRMLFSKNYRQVFLNAHIIHFVGEKPWDEKIREAEKQYSSVEQKWWEYHYE
jgi:lipopolysaccharide biosynthesis glycosyltransferase